MVAEVGVAVYREGAAWGDWLCIQYERLWEHVFSINLHIVLKRVLFYFALNCEIAP